MSKQVFEYTSKPGEVFEFGGTWYISEECNYINQYQAEEGFDIFVPRSGNYTTAHEISAESQEVQAHLAQKEVEHQAWMQAQEELKTRGRGMFAVGQTARFAKNKKVVVITEISPEGDIRVSINGKANPMWWQPGQLEAI